MKLENTLSIPVPADEAWRVLLDIERIAPCVPGATLTGNDGESYRGKIKVLLG
ncbi:MAG: carbon monoxide dehydrogenase, partial [Streptomycetaceae bacterium]|nr:carbon monoxide dehydrogenase [Streptomycetaceae bacterium]